MSDIVERLRTPSIVMREGILNLSDDAAIEIESLRQRVADITADRDMQDALRQQAQELADMLKDKLAACAQERDDKSRVCEIAMANNEQLTRYMRHMEQQLFICEKERDDLLATLKNLYAEQSKCSVGIEQYNLLRAELVASQNNVQQLREALEDARGALAYVAVGNEDTNLARTTCAHGVRRIDNTLAIQQQPSAE